MGLLANVSIKQAAFIMLNLEKYEKKGAYSPTLSNIVHICHLFIRFTKMKKNYRIKKNGESLQLYDKLGYAGSISLKQLCHIVRNRAIGGTKEEVAQDSVKEIPQAH